MNKYKRKSLSSNTKGWYSGGGIMCNNYMQHPSSIRRV